MTSGERYNTAFSVAIFALTVAVYANTLDNPFVRDDDFQVLSNPWIRDLKFIPKILVSDVWAAGDASGGSNFYRPLMYIFYSLSYMISGLKPWGFHIVNIVFHALSAVLVFKITLFFTRNHSSTSSEKDDQGSGANMIVAAAAALFFGAHPINTEPVGWVAAVPEITFTFFYLLSFYLYTRAEKLGSGLFVASVLLFIPAAFSKETASTLPILIVVYEMFLRRRAITETVKRVVPFGAVVLFYIAVRVSVLKGMAPMKAAHLADLSTFQILLNIPPLFIKYLVKLILPVSLNFDYTFTPVLSLADPEAFVPIITTVVLATLLYLAYQRRREIFFTALWIAIPLLPVLYLPALSLNTFTERYLYLPCAAFAILLALIISTLTNKDASTGTATWRGKKTFIAISIIVIALYSIGTIKRNIVWGSALTLWEDTVTKSPGSRIAHNNFGIALAKDGRLEEALAEHRAALKLDPTAATTYNNMGVVYAKMGNIELAMKSFQAAVMIDNNFEEAQKNLRQALKIMSGTN